MRKLLYSLTLLTLMALSGCDCLKPSSEPREITAFSFKKVKTKFAQAVSPKKEEIIDEKVLKKVSMRHIHKTIPPFDKLLVDGNINVEFHTGYTTSSIVIKGDQRDLLALTTEVKNNTLVLHVGAGVPDHNPIFITVKGRYIHSVKLKENAHIKGLAIKTNYLDLDISDNSSAHFSGYIMPGHVNIKDQGLVELDGVKGGYMEVCLKNSANLKIKGEANLATLNAEDKSHFSMAWVDSSNLVAKVGGNAYIQLAGVVNKLDACVTDHAQWNGRFLRSRRTYMKTFGNALTRISAVSKQHTLASDRSNIYFYNLSTYRTDFMAYDGSVLDMRDWKLRARQDYDAYNKAG